MTDPAMATSRAMDQAAEPRATGSSGLAEDGHVMTCVECGENGTCYGQGCNDPTVDHACFHCGGGFDGEYEGGEDRG